MEFLIALAFVEALVILLMSLLTMLYRNKWIESLNKSEDRLDKLERRLDWLEDSVLNDNVSKNVSY